MKISSSWLSEYIETGLDTRELCDILTQIGLEVEGLETYESVRGGLRGCVIGKVRECLKHPDADRLTLCKVDVGGTAPLDIVCGAPNVAEGQKVVVAQVGTTLYKGEKAFTLKKTKIRGALSEGMICAEDELGLGDSHEGIMVLEPSAEIGREAGDYFGVTSDAIIEIGLSPNRADAASHFGVARDLAAYLRQETSVNLKKPPVDDFSVDHTDLSIGVRIENPEACPRYCGITLSSAEVKASPAWLQQRLLSIGLKPINNVVDITNFVLHELGQPLHAFDADRISGGEVIVRTLPGGTPFTTLDEVERKLAADDLMICDSEKGMCIAGVFGGMHSGVDFETRNIFLESAYFDPGYVRRTSKRHGLSTDASFRFERGADPEMTLYALKRAAILIRELSGARISSEIVDVYPGPVKSHAVTLNFARMNRLVGQTIEPGKVLKILKALEVEILKESAEGLELRVPPYRVDVRREADVVEDILRIYGYNRIGFREQMTSKVTHIEKPDKEKLVQLISDLLSSNGFTEIMNNSLSKESYYSDDREAVSLQNPLSTDLNHMRTTLLFGGLETILFNINHQRNRLRLFEFGNVYQYVQGGDPSKVEGYREEEVFGLFIHGNQHEGNWIEKTKPGSFFELKSYLENILDRLGLDLNNLDIKPVEHALLDEGLSYHAGKTRIAELGMVSHTLLQSFGISTEVFYAEIPWTQILPVLQDIRITVKPVPRFPEVRRDLSMLIDRETSFREIRDLALKAERRLLKSITLFDVYESEKLGAGKKSYALGFVLQDSDKTLTDKEIDKAMGRIQAVLEKEINASIRQATS